MLRRLLNVLTALSLLLCVAVVALWVRSYRIGAYGEFLGSLDVHTGDSRAVIRNVGVYSSHGRLGVGLTQSDQALDDPYRARYSEGWRLVADGRYCWERSPFIPVPGSPASRLWHGIDFRNLSWKTWTSVTTSRGVAVPHWLAAGSFAALPLWCFCRYWRRRRRHPVGHCPWCGYDLRATPGRCPECGEVARPAV